MNSDKRCLSRRFWLALSAALLCGTSAFAASLPAPINAELQRLGIPKSAFSLYVQRVALKKPRLALNATQSRNPASVMKVLTSLAALDVLGPAYTWRTEAWLNGNLKAGRLQGDLILKGYGDPFLTPEKFWQFLRGLQARGLQHIDGDLVLDTSLFSSPSQDRAAFDGKPHRAYNALPNALSLNFQATQITLRPDQGNGQVHAFSYPPLSNLQVDNGIQLIDGPCKRGQRSPTINFRRAGGSATLELRGKLASTCPEGESSFLVMSPTEQLEGAFRALWTELGGTLGGRVRGGTLQDTSELFHQIRSRPLIDILRGMNKFSNNLMSRLVFLTMGLEQHDAPGTPDKARSVVREWLREARIKADNIMIDNGAGLSRDSRISVADLGRMLRSAYFSPYMAEFISSLPIIGVDGTMRRRLQNTDMIGRGHIKTGSIEDVNAMAGYVQDKKNRRWIVVSIINHQGVGWKTKRIQDAVLKWVYEGAG